jgi:predicted DNA-binding protein (MmcQ/YjbR family)
LDLEAVRAHCLSLPAVTEDLPFGDDVLVFRVNKKIFLLTNLNDTPSTFNAKCEPSLAVTLRDQHEAIVPGWHMNKKHWNTVTLDGSLPAQLVRDLITHSYLRIVAGLTRAERAALGELPAAPALGEQG